MDLKIRGTEYVPATKIRKRIHAFSIRSKKDNLAGLQLADVLATPIGRNVLGKRTYADYSQGGDFFETVKTKLRCSRQGDYLGLGLVILPK